MPTRHSAHTRDSDEDTGHATPPPAYHTVTGRHGDGHNPDVKSEKPSPAAAAMEEKHSPQRTPARPRRHCFLRRLWDRVTYSEDAEIKRLARDMREGTQPAVIPRSAPRFGGAPSPPPPPQSQPVIALKGPTPQAGRFNRPVTYSSLQRGRIPTIRRHKYTVTSQHSPILTLCHAEATTAPWMAELTLYFDDLATQLPRHVPWFENLHRCWVDRMDVIDHPWVRDTRVYARRMRVDFTGEEEVLKVEVEKGQEGEGVRESKWGVALTVLSRDAEWLAGLSYEEAGGLVARWGSAVVELGQVLPTNEPLEMAKLFHLRFLKPVRGYVFMALPSLKSEADFASEKACGKALKADEPELRRLVERELKTYPLQACR